MDETTFTKAHIVNTAAEANTEKYISQFKIPCNHTFRIGAKFGAMDVIRDVSLFLSLAAESGEITKESRDSLVEKIDELRQRWEF